MQFDSTRWSLVVAAGGADPVAARDALGTLCEAYWYPLYALIRRRGADPDAARDLTQGFLASLLERNDFEGLRPERGRFRAFLLPRSSTFSPTTRPGVTPSKRGGRITVLPLADDESEGRYRHEPVDVETPERLYERRWALMVVDGVMNELRDEWAHDRRAAEFDALNSALLGDAPPGGYAAVAARLGTTAGAVKLAVHRFEGNELPESEASICGSSLIGNDVHSARIQSHRPGSRPTNFPGLFQHSQLARVLQRVAPPRLSGSSSCPARPVLVFFHPPRWP